MEQDFNLEQTLLEFNQDPNFIELRERYSTRSFLEIMSVERSENRHSSFLAWLLEAKDFAVNPKDHPIVHLLDILIRRKREQNTDCPKLLELRDIVLARDIKDIKLLEKITTEKTVGDATSNPKIYGKIADRLDIYMKVALSSLQGEEHVFEIIIENKVGSIEGLPKKKDEKKWPEGYAGKYQTERYYAACQSNNRIFVFLTPISTKELDNFKDILEDDKKSREPHFININYQDLLDEVIEPLLANKNLSQRVRILLEEYILSLALPAAAVDENDKNTAKESIIMAVSKKEIELIEDIFKKYPSLIIQSALSYRAALGGIEESESENNDLLCKFCETNKALIIATLRVAIEQEGNEEKKKEYLNAYKALTYNAKDYSQYSFDNVDYWPKGQFAQVVLNMYVKQNAGNAGLCTKAKEDFGFSKKNFWPILIDGNYNIDGERLNGNDGPVKIERKRYNQSDDGHYLISTQWGALPSREGSFDLFLRSIVTSETFNKGEYRGKPGRPQNPKELKVQEKLWGPLLGDVIFEQYDKH